MNDTLPDVSTHTYTTLEQQEPILQFFEYAHLRDDLKAISQPFKNLATSLMHVLPRNPERSVALRKLLEAKDAAVRARLYR